MKSKYPILFLLLLVVAGCAKEATPPQEDVNPSLAAEQNAANNTFATLMSNGEERFLRVSGLHDWLIVNPSVTSSFPDGARVLATFTEASGVTYNVITYATAVSILLMEAVEEASTAQADNETTEPDEAYYGTPLQIIFDWITTAEAGYLTLHYRILQSGAVQHRFLLRPFGTDYDYALYHDSQGDEGEEPGEGVVCFPLSPEPQGEDGETPRIRLHYLDFSGKVKTLVLVYRNGI